MDEKLAGGVQSAEVALHLLRVLAEEGGDLPLSQLAAAAGMPAAKVHRYVVSLQRAGFVDQTARSANYTLGGEALRIGLAALARLDVVELGAAAAADLCRRTGQTVLLAIWGDHGPTIVRMCEPPRPITINVRVGSAMPLLSSATGQVFGAWLPWETVEPFMAAESAAPGAPLAPAEAAPAEARATFESVRSAGLSVVTGSMLHGIQALGAPVFGPAGELRAALTVLGTHRSFDPALDGDVAGALRMISHGLSHRIGGDGTTCFRKGFA